MSILTLYWILNEQFTVSYISVFRYSYDWLNLKYKLYFNKDVFNFNLVEAL